MCKIKLWNRLKKTWNRFNIIQRFISHVFLHDSSDRWRSWPAHIHSFSLSVIYEIFYTSRLYFGDFFYIFIYSSELCASI